SRPPRSSLGDILFSGARSGCSGATAFAATVSAARRRAAAGARRRSGSISGVSDSPEFPVLWPSKQGRANASVGQRAESERAETQPGVPERAFAEQAFAGWR